MNVARRYAGDERVTVEWTEHAPLDDVLTAATARVRDLVAPEHRHFVSVSVWFDGEEGLFLTCQVKYDESPVGDS